MILKMDICFCNFIVDVNNVFMIFIDYLLIIWEGIKREVRCVVNCNVVFVLNINWYFDFLEIISRVGIDIIVILIGNRVDNIKML